ncbi:hypothetical protein EWH99_10600 [Sporolactobacillus sp. THM7-7]|nr:hypothetical protein EWH99_10600 [Sporolactobacillus sp. THM7-7]
MNLMTDELKERVTEKDLPMLQKQINCFEMMQCRSLLNLANGRIEDALESVVEELRCIRDIQRMADQAQIWKNTYQLMEELQAMGYDIQRIEVKKHG